MVINMNICCLQTAAQQQKPQAAVESDVDAEDASLLPSSDSVAAASSSIANSAVAAADKATAAVKSAPPQVNSAANKAVNKAAKQAEALKRKLGTPKARSVRKRGWKADANQLVKSAKQWGLAHPAELGLAGVVVAMVCMVYALLSRQSSQVSVS